MSLNLDKNKDALVTAWREVMDLDNATNWALFGYDGLSFDLNLISKGDGGLEELIEDFNSGKIMYALCRVKVKEKNLEKIVLINWQGEGAPLSRKGTCANHLGHIKSFFKGVHVTINARADEDVEPDVILKTVGKATAGEGVQHSMSTDVQGIIGPIGTSYKKVNPKEDINSAAKDEFWRHEEQEEERRKREEQNKLRKFSQNEVKLLRRESQEYFNETEAEKNSGSAYFKNQTTPPQSKLNGSASSNSSLNSSSSVSSATAAAVKASTPMKNSNSENSRDLVRQRIKSFDQGTPRTPVNFNSAGVNSGNNETGETLSVLKRRQLFESHLSTPNYSNLAAKTDPAQEIKQAQEQEKLRIQQQKQKQTQNAVAPTPVAPVSPVVNSMPTTKFDNNSFDTVVRSKTSAPPSSQSASLPEQNLQKTISSSPVSSPYPVASVNGNSNKAFQITDNKQITATTNDHKNGYGARDDHEEEQEDTTVQSAENFKGSHVTDNNVHSLNERENVATPTFEILPEMGTCARALYDYEAADSSEISFDPGDVITNIEQIDEGWWEGMGPHGVYGLFPANYVELVG